MLVLLDSPYRHSLIVQPRKDARQCQPGTEIDAGFLDEGHVVGLLRLGSLAGDTNSAPNRLALWIDLNAPLSEALAQMGYRRTQRIFTSRQVALIFEHLGEP